MDERLEENGMTDAQTIALIRAIRIINREVKDVERLDKALQEIEDAIVKGDAADDQSTR